MRNFDLQKWLSFPFIVFEGFSGSGKTTIAGMLAQDLGGICIASHDFIGTIRQIFGRESDLSDRFMYYLLGNVYCSDIAKREKIFHPVLCDRYIYSTIALHSLLGVHVVTDIPLLNLLQPDIKLFLSTSDENERRKRVGMRSKKKNKYDEMQENDKFRRKYVEYFHSVGGFIFIETAHRSIDEVLAEVKKNILNKFSLPIL